MARYWTTAPARIVDDGPVRYACHVFEHGHKGLALCQVYGFTSEEANMRAHCIVAAMLAVEQRPAVAAAARHYIVRSPLRKDVAVHCGEATTLAMAYDEYFDQCQLANKTPKTFDQWKESCHE